MYVSDTLLYVVYIRMYLPVVVVSGEGRVLLWNVGSCVAACSTAVWEREVGWVAFGTTSAVRWL